MTKVIKIIISLFLISSTYATNLSKPLIKTLQEGGNVLLFRVPESIIGSDRVVFSSRNYENCHEQRTLSTRGVSDSETIKKAIRNQGISISEVISSSYCRTLQSSSISFPEKAILVNRLLNSICRESSENMSRFSRELLRKIQTPVSNDNRVIMGHQCNIQYLLKDAITAFDSNRIRLGAGEALVIRPLGDHYKIVGIISLKTWYQWAEIPFSTRPEQPF